MVDANHKINYLELPMKSAATITQFYSAVFGWEFVEWGPGYWGFTGGGVDGGFSSDRTTCPTGSGPLVVLYSNDLDATLSAVIKAGGTISVEPFPFPGGQRFHFVDPDGNELAVWTAVCDSTTAA